MLCEIKKIIENTSEPIQGILEKLWGLLWWIFGSLSQKNFQKEHTKVEGFAWKNWGEKRCGSKFKFFSFSGS